MVVFLGLEEDIYRSVNGLACMSWGNGRMDERLCAHFNGVKSLWFRAVCSRNDDLSSIN